MSQSRQVRPFGIRDKIGYLFGDFGNDFTFILSTMILMKFYTDVIGVSAGVVGTIMMAARFVDAFTDVTMGRICDLSRPVPGVGKFRPWIKRMCVPVAAASFLMYLSSPASWPYAAKVIYLFVTYILWGSVFYTSINIPYGSMASAVSPDAGDRQSLSTFRSVGATLAGLFVGVLLPVIAYQKIDGAETLVGSRVTLAAGVFSLLAIACYLICYALTQERVIPEAAEGERKSTLEVLKSALHNRALISVIAASIVMLLAQLTMQNMSGYIYPDYYNNSRAQSVSTVLMTVGMLVAAALAKPLAARFGKAEVSA
ncbi:MAG: MFS transporter, partial [Candidatus Ventricola sp.]